MRGSTRLRRPRVTVLAGVVVLVLVAVIDPLSAGIMLLIFRPYKVGDVIVVGGQTGKVDEIDLFSTTLDTADNRRILIPNASIFGSTIENTSFHRTRRVNTPWHFARKPQPRWAAAMRGCPPCAPRRPAIAPARRSHLTESPADI